MYCHFILTDIGGEESLSKGFMLFTLWALKDSESNVGGHADWMTSELS